MYEGQTNLSKLREAIAEIDEVRADNRACAKDSIIEHKLNNAVRYIGYVIFDGGEF